MNLFLLLIGMALGFFSHRWPKRAAALVVACVLISLVWGAVFASGLVAGTLWALVNLGVGVAIAAGVRWTFDRAGDGPIGG